MKYGIEFRAIGVTGVQRIADRIQATLANGDCETARFLLNATGVRDDLPLTSGFDQCRGPMNKALPHRELVA